MASEAGRWHRVEPEDARRWPVAVWGLSATLINGSALLFGGESPLSSYQPSGLWWLAPSPSSPSRRGAVAPSAVPSRGVVPLPRRQHAAATLFADRGGAAGGSPSAAALVVGGMDDAGTPLGEAWSVDLERAGTAEMMATWTLSGLEGTHAAVLARAAHSLTALPPPPGPLYLRRTTDAAFLLFGGLSTPRVAALARSTADGNSSHARFRAAAAADAREFDAAPAALNDLWLLSRLSGGEQGDGAPPTWRLTRLAAPNEVGCTATAGGGVTIPPSNVAPDGTAAAAAAVGGGLSLAQAPRRATRRQRGVDGAGGRPLVPPLGLDVLSQVVSARTHDPVAEELSMLNARALTATEAAYVAAWRAPRSPTPCARAGHTAHLYRGQIGGMSASDCGGPVAPEASASDSGASAGSASGGAYGCLLIFGGVDGTSSRLADLWSLPIDARWARTRESAPQQRAAPLRWRAMEYSAAGALPPPRAHHAAVLYREYLYAIGGEPCATADADCDHLWQLHLPSLRWTRMRHAAVGGHAAPRPGAGAAAVVLAVQSAPPTPPPAAATAEAKAAGEAAGETAATGEAAGEAADFETDDAQSMASSRPSVLRADRPPPTNAIVLLGGHRAAGDELSMWLFHLGRTCGAADAPGCPPSEVCDGAHGQCACPSGERPPCDPAWEVSAALTSNGTPHGAAGAHSWWGGVTLAPGALELVVQAWIIVAVSALGAHVGGLAGRRAPGKH